MSVPRLNRSHICIDCLREIKMYETFFIINLYIPMLVFDNSIIFKENILAVSEKIVWSTFVIWLLNFFFIPNSIKCKCFPCVVLTLYLNKHRYNLLGLITFWFSRCFRCEIFGLRFFFFFLYLFLLGLSTKDCQTLTSIYPNCTYLA